MIFSGRTKMIENCNGHLSFCLNRMHSLLSKPQFCFGEPLILHCSVWSIKKLQTRFTSLDILGDAVDKKPPDNAGDMGSISGLGRFYMPCVSTCVCPHTHACTCTHSPIKLFYPPSLPSSLFREPLFTSILFSHF